LKITSGHGVDLLQQRRGRTLETDPAASDAGALDDQQLCRWRDIIDPAHVMHDR
jgi:hypothetical protein